MALIADMDRPTEKGHSADQRFLATGLLVSVALHAFAGWMLVEDVDPFKTPPGPEAVEVELVPPPEVVVPEPPEQAEEPEEEERPEVAETEPEEEPVEPETEQEPEEEQIASLPQPEEQEIRVLQPVVEFGEEDSGPSDSEDGAPQQAEEETETDEPEEEPEPETVSEEPEEADEPLTAEEEPAEEPGDETEIAEPTDETEPSEESPAEQQTTEEQPQETPPETSEVATGETPLEPEPSEPEPEPEPEPAEEAAGEETGPEDFGSVGKIVTSATPVAKPKRTTAERRGSSRRMVRARRFFSDDLASDPRVRTAMAGMGQSERLNLLCMTELRGQLTAANPPMFADLMPSFRPPPGTVLEPRNAAVRSFGQWFDIDFRCEVDHSVTRVVSFEYRIGPEIPRSQWKQRGFPG